MNNVQPMPGQPQQQQLPPLPEDIASLYSEDNDPHMPLPGELASMLQNELDGIATGIVQLEQQEQQIKRGLASARGLARSLEREIVRLKDQAAEQELEEHEASKESE